MQISPSCQIPNLDKIYEGVFKNKKGFFIDIGAFDGYVFSNCWGLAEEGWHGIFIEPNPELFKLCKQRYASNPNVELLECAVGQENKDDVLLYLGGTLTTTSLESLELYDQISWSSGLLDKDRFTKVPMMTLDHILKNYTQEIDVISLDTEGTELDILKGFDIINKHPRIVIVETHELSLDSRL